MKKYSLILILPILLLSVDLFADCVKGDCNNGRGTLYDSKGNVHQKGTWKNGKFVN